MGLPNINVIFKTIATTAAITNVRGIVALIIKDDTDKTFSTKSYTLVDDVTTDEALYTATNLQYIEDVFTGSITKVIVVRIDVAGVIADALTTVATLTVNWVGIAEGVQTDQDALVTFIKAQEILKKTYKAVVFAPTTVPDCKHIVVLENTNVVFTDARKSVTGEKYVASLLGILASTSLSESSTYEICSNLTSVTIPSNVDTSIDAGNLVLINDDNVVKIGRGVTSLTTITETNTADMKKIAIVEAIDLIHEGIATTFKNSYSGKYKNKYDNQIIFVSAVNTYFKALVAEDILDEDYTNICTIDVDTQKAAWVEDGKDVSTWTTDADVLNHPYKSNVFLTSNIKILDAMEDLDLTNNLY